LAEVHDFLTADEHAGSVSPLPQYFLAGATAEDGVEIPVEVYRIKLTEGLAARTGDRLSEVPSWAAADAEVGGSAGAVCRGVLGQHGAGGPAYYGA
jgi:hypothetical protein